MPFPRLDDIVNTAIELAAFIAACLLYIAVEMMYMSVGHNAASLSYDEKFIIAANIAVVWYLIKRWILVSLGEQEEEDLQPIAGNVIFDLIVQHAGWIALGMVGCVLCNLMV